MDLSKTCKIIKIYINEDAKYKGHTLYHQIVKKMSEMDMAGVTVTRGIEGYGHDRRIHNANMLQVSLKLPVIIEIIDNIEKVEQAVPVLNEMLTEGLMIMTDVNVIKYGDKVNTFHVD